MLSEEGFGQMGFALKDSVKPTCNEEPEGCGDDEASWAVDGSRLVKWHDGQVTSSLPIPDPSCAAPRVHPFAVPLELP